MQRLNLQTFNTKTIPLMRYQKLVQSQAIQGNWYKWLRTLLFVVFQSIVHGCTLQKWFIWSVRLAGLGLTASVHLNIKWSFFPCFHLDQSALLIDRKLLCNLGNFLFGEDSKNFYKGLHLVEGKDCSCNNFFHFLPVWIFPFIFLFSMLELLPPCGGLPLESDLD